VVQFRFEFEPAVLHPSIDYGKVRVRRNLMRISYIAHSQPKKEDDHEIRTGIQRGYELGGCEEIYGRKEMGNALV
jgi:hypothetical protein